MAITCRTRLIWRLLPRESRCRTSSPEEASIGAVPVQDAKWLLRPQESRRQDLDGSDAVPQTATLRPGLQDHARRPRGRSEEGPGRTTGQRLCLARPAHSLRLDTVGSQESEPFPCTCWANTLPGTRSDAVALSVVVRARDGHRLATRWEAVLEHKSLGQPGCFLGLGCGALGIRTPNLLIRRLLGVVQGRPDRSDPRSSDVPRRQVSPVRFGRVAVKIAVRRTIDPASTLRFKVGALRSARIVRGVNRPRFSDWRRSGVHSRCRQMPARRVPLGTVGKPQTDPPPSLTL